MSDVQPQTQTPPTPAHDRTALARRILVLAVVIYVILFVVLNTHRVKISFVFFTVHTMTLIALAVVAALSFGAGYFLRGRRTKRR
jgi:uncharacterized integral membrane protein